MKRKRRWDESARGQLHMTAIPFLLRILFSPHFPSPISEWLLKDAACCLLPRPFIRGCFHENAIWTFFSLSKPRKNVQKAFSPVLSAREIDHGCQIAAWTRWRTVRLREVGVCGRGCLREGVLAGRGACGKGREGKMGLQRASE